MCIRDRCRYTCCDATKLAGTETGTVAVRSKVDWRYTLSRTASFDDAVFVFNRPIKPVDAIAILDRSCSEVIR